MTQYLIEQRPLRGHARGRRGCGRSGRRLRRAGGWRGSRGRGRSLDSGEPAGAARHSGRRRAPSRSVPTRPRQSGSCSRRNGNANRASGPSQPGGLPTRPTRPAGPAPPGSGRGHPVRGHRRRAPGGFSCGNSRPRSGTVLESSTGAGSLAREEFNGRDRVAGRPVRGPHADQEPGVHAGRRGVAGHWGRGQRGHVQHRRRPDPPPAGRARRPAAS